MDGLASDARGDGEDPPVGGVVPDPTAQPSIEDENKTKKLEGAGAKQPCGRVVGIIRRHWREKQYCGSLLKDGDRDVVTGKGQTTSALFVPVDRKASHSVTPPISNQPASLVCFVFLDLSIRRVTLPHTVSEMSRSSHCPLDVRRTPRPRFHG